MRTPFPAPRRTLLALLLALCVVLVACGGGDEATGDDADDDAVARATATPAGGAGAEDARGEDGPDAGAGDPPGEEPTAEATPTPEADPRERAAEVGANELGAVPIIMYHRLLPDGGGEYDLTPEEFRGELARLYEEGYRPIRTVDLVRGHIDVPAGTTPVVLTFDDGSREQFAYGEDGEVDPDTAIGILLAFAEEHPDFTPVASMYLNAGPFGGGTGYEAMLVDLHERGFELGNHTHGHANLRNSGAEEIRRQLALGVTAITDIVPEAEVVTLSLPFGIWPDDRALAVSGSWEGSEYAHEGVLLVGAGPAPSPFHTDFDALALPRIRSSPSWEGGEPDYGSAFWLDWLAAEPGRRYVSDGDPDTIAFPEELAEQLDPRHTDRAVGY